MAGPIYWRSLDEHEGAPAEPDELVQLSPTPRVSRRGFLQLLGATSGMVGLAGCSAPRGRALPYNQKPEDLIPGDPLHYATSVSLGGYASGLLVTSHEGRPTKVEGNPDHPASRGA